MARYGQNLEQLFFLRKGIFTTESIFSLGLQLIYILEQVHAAGLTYNDLKLDNILLDYGTDVEELSKTQENIFESNNITLIDFGFATEYHDGATQKHMKKQYVDAFRGNLLFSSLNQLKFYSTSRRDDLISLFYFLAYLVH